MLRITHLLVRGIKQDYMQNIQMVRMYFLLLHGIVQLAMRKKIC